MKNNHKTGKVYLKEDGRYFIRYQKKEGDYDFVYGVNKKEVLEKYHLVTSVSYPSLFCEDIYNFLRSLKISCKKSSYSHYEYTVYAHLIPFFGQYKRDQINKNMIHHFTEKMLYQGLAPKTVKDILVLLQQILKYYDIHIDITMPKIPKKEVQIFTRSHQEYLEKKLSSNISADSFGVFLCLYTGLRIGELCGLRWENIDLKNNIIRVEKTLIRVKNYDSKKKGKTIVILDAPKSTSSIRSIPIPTFMVPTLKLLQKEKSCFFLTGNEKFIEPRCYSNHYKNILKSIGIDIYNFHALRHTFATRCIENGFDPKTLSEILGHSDVKITLDRYVHPSFDNKVKMMNAMHPMCSLFFSNKH